MYQMYIAKSSTLPLMIFLAFFAASEPACPQTAPPSAGGSPQQQTSYLPLGQGEKWSLESPQGQKMTFEVIGRDGDASRVRWQNPWNRTDFMLVPSGNKVLLQSLDMGQGTAPMPANTVYFDFDQPRGGSWSNALGKIDVLSRGGSVKTPAGDFEDTVQIRATDKNGFATYFTFAKDIGFVQFGDGSDAFRLTSHSGGARAESTPRPQTPASSSGPLLIGLDANPPPTEGYSNDANDKRFKMARDAGMSMTFLHPKWNELEPQSGKYAFDQVEFRQSLARKYDVPILLNLRIVDGPNRAMPDSYKNWKFDDPRLADRLNQLLRRFSPDFRSRVRWVAIGNEVDHYFDTHKNEIGPYATLISRVLPTVRDLFPNAPFSVTFSDQHLGDLRGIYKPILDHVDFYSYNYYPINPDFTFRDPNGSAADLKRMIDAAGGRPVFFQELGYASSPQLGSSEDKQARFIEVALDTLGNFDQVIGANFNWMSDLPDSVVDDLGRYYKVNGENFKQFLGTLGLFDKNGQPKKAWNTFKGRASSISRR